MVDSQIFIGAPTQHMLTMRMAAYAASAAHPLRTVGSSPARARMRARAHATETAGLRSIAPRRSHGHGVIVWGVTRPQCNVKLRDRQHCMRMPSADREDTARNGVYREDFDATFWGRGTGTCVVCLNVPVPTGAQAAAEAGRVHARPPTSPVCHIQAPAALHPFRGCRFLGFGAVQKTDYTTDRSRAVVLGCTKRCAGLCRVVQEQTQG